jgi:outer membrane protein assembly factor BamB
LKSSSFITIHESGNRVFAGANGEIYCLDRMTGSILWHDKLKGLGLGIVAFSGDSDVVAAAAEAAARAEAAGPP